MEQETAISLGDYYTTFIDRQVECGKFSDAAEVLRAGLRLLQREDAHLEALRIALIEGDESGISESSVADIWESVLAEARGDTAPQ